MSMGKIEFKSSKGFLRPKLSDIFSGPLVLDSKDRTSGVYGWVALVLGIMAYDIYAIKSSKIETLTRSFWRLTEKPSTGSIFIGAWLGLTFHLLIEKLIRKQYS
jgi:hypothetical protein